MTQLIKALISFYKLDFLCPTGEHEALDIEPCARHPLFTSYSRAAKPAKSGDLKNAYMQGF